jgi:HNH endonuclease
VTAEEFRRLLRYDPETGEFMWIVERRSGVPAHKRAGSIHKKGYVHIVVNGRSHRAHRLAWLYMTGAWPREQIDHRNGVRSDNRWDNLRDATQSVNQQNRTRAMRTNGTGLLGAFRNGDLFCSKIRIDGKQRYLGTFRTAEAAHQVYMAAKRQLHEGFV